MLWPASHLHPFRNLFAYFPMASHLLWVSDCFYMLQGCYFTKHPRQPQALSECDESCGDESWCGEGNALWHSSWGVQAVFTFSTSTHLYSKCLWHYRPQISLFCGGVYDLPDFTLSLYCFFFFSGKVRGSTNQGMACNCTACQSCLSSMWN